METNSIYHQLVKKPLPYRRTDGDFRRDSFTKRVQFEKFLREEPSIRVPGISKPSLVSSYQGKIQRILFMFPSWAVNAPEFVKSYKSVISSLRKGTKFIVVHHSSIKSVIEKWFKATGHKPSEITYVPVPDYVSFTDWAEDAFVAIVDKDDNTNYLIEPWEFLRAGDALIADNVKEYDNISMNQAPLIFQGGNCLIGDQFWLLGKDYFIDTIELLKGRRAPIDIAENITNEQLKLLIHRLFKDYVDSERKLIVIGTDKAIPQRDYYGTKEGSKYYLDYLGGAGTFQPIFHIDMFITLVGKENNAFQILVGSPKLGDEILGIKSKYDLNQAYDKIASDLSKQGFKVIRNPLYHAVRKTGDTYPLKELIAYSQQPEGQILKEAINELRAHGANENTNIVLRDMYHITWNNCLVENDTIEKGVYLPTFGYNENKQLKKLDKYMENLWKKLGFKVNLLADFTPFAQRQGVVHCIKKYIDRANSKV